MKTRFSALALALLMLSGYALAADNGKGSDPQPPAKEAGKKKSQAKKLPGQARWDFQAIHESFTVVGMEYAAANRQVTWTLEAKQKVAGKGYRAVFLDPDHVQVADVGVTFLPVKKEYEKGARVKVVLTLPAKEDFDEANRVMIQPKK